MPSRYTITEKWSDSWFSKLKSIEKLLFIYLCDNCDCAGFIEINLKKWAFDIDENQTTIKGALKGLGRGLIYSNSEDCIYIKNFLRHQRNVPLNPSNKAHMGILKRFDLYINKFDIKDINEFIQAPSKPLPRGYGNGNSNGNNSNKDFIDVIVSKFKEAYFEIFNSEYIVVSEHKERIAASSLLELFKKKHPDSTTEETSEALKKYFLECCKVDNDWMRKNMSLHFIISKFNEINNTIKQSKNGKDTVVEKVKEFKRAER